MTVESRETKIKGEKEMETDNHKTKVIFRKFKDGDIIALFPEEPGTNDPQTCSSYMHIGQHCVADMAIVPVTKIATADEYAALKEELESIGYNLEITYRVGASMRIKRERAIN